MNIGDIVLVKAEIESRLIGEYDKEMYETFEEKPISDADVVQYRVADWEAIGWWPLWDALPARLPYRVAVRKQLPEPVRCMYLGRSHRNCGRVIPEEEVEPIGWTMDGPEYVPAYLEVDKVITVAYVQPLRQTGRWSPSFVALPQDVKRVELAETQPA